MARLPGQSDTVTATATINAPTPVNNGKQGLHRLFRLHLRTQQAIDTLEKFVVAVHQ